MATAVLADEFELAWPIPTPAPLAAVAAPVDMLLNDPALLNPPLPLAATAVPPLPPMAKSAKEELGVSALGVAVGILIGVVVLPGQVDREVVAAVRPCLLEDPDMGVGVLIDVGIGVSIGIDVNG